MDDTTIRELVLGSERLEQDERTPFASIPWTTSSRVIWQDSADTAAIVVGDMTFEYFLEPSIISEVKEGLNIADPEALVERVIQYAQDDA